MKKDILHHVCHVTSVHPWCDGRIFFKECISLSQCYQVSLIAPNVDDVVKDGIMVFGVKLPQGRLGRMLHLNRVYQKMVEVDADVYHFHDPELLSLGIKIKQKQGKHIIFDSHEDVPSQILDKQWIPFVFRMSVSRLYSKLESRWLPQYDAVVSVTPSIVERLQIINPRTYMVTNYPKYEEQEEECSYLPQVCFTGGISSLWGHEAVLSAIAHLDCTYVLAGWGEKKYLEGLKSYPSWGKVKYLGKVTPEKCKEIQRNSIAGMAICSPSHNTGGRRGTLGNTKIYEYMMAGIPVIATGFDLWKEVVEGNDCGICVNHSDIDQIAKAIGYYLENPQEAKRQGDNGRRAVREKYNWTTQEQVLIHIYE